MGFFDLFRPAVARVPEAARVEPPVMTAAAGQDVQSPSQWRGFAVGGGVSKAGVRVTETGALSIPATMQALRVLCGVFAMTPLHYYKKGEKGRTRADDLPEGRLFNSAPNSHQTPYSFLELLLGDLLLCGNFYAYKSRGPRGEVTALTRLLPASVVVATYFDRQSGVVLFYDATLPDGTRERFPARDIFHVAGMSRDGIAGLNPIAYMRDALGGAVATSDHAARFWQSGGRPSTVLTTKGRISPEDKKLIRRDWQAMHSGPSGDQVAVLDQDLTADFLTHNLKDSQFLETRQFQIADLARIWGVPPHLIFDLSKATFSNIEHQSLEMVTMHMGPHFARVAQAATRSFGGEGYYFEHMTDALVRGDMKSRYEAYWLQRQMGIANADEMRARENLPPIEGAAGAEYWRPANMMVAGAPPAPPVHKPTSEESQ